VYLRTAALLITCTATAQWAQQKPVENPHTSAADVTAGARIFRAHCAVCHGPDGAGGRAPSLARGEFRHARNDEELYNVIADGIPGTQMPSTFFHGTQLWQVAAYVRSLSQRPSGPPLRGDAVSGKVVFSGKGGCQMCHMVDGEGGRLAPDLSRIGETRSAEHLRTSILRPNDQIFTYERAIRAVTTDGKTITGRRLNEDTYSVQLLDARENMVSLLKSEISEYEVVSESTMPSYEGKLTETELDDLIAYLASLQRKRNP
jgi:putative heme-binding domain-containing protein